MDSDGDDTVPRLATAKKKKADKKANKSERRAAAKKRQRSGSVSKSDGVGSDDPRERLAAFHARMFDAKHDEKTPSLTAPANPEDAVLLAKWKPGKDGKSSKKRRTARGGGDNDGDGDDVPRIAIKAKRATGSSKDKSGEKTHVVVPVVAKLVKTTATSSAVQAPGAAVPSPALKRKSTLSADDNKTPATLNITRKGQQQPATTVAASSVKTPKLQESKDSALVTLAAESAAALDPIGGASSKTTPSGVVTQDELSELRDELSLEDPLERALRTAKELAAKSRAAKPKPKANAKKQRKPTLSSDSGAVQVDGTSVETAPLVAAMLLADKKSASAEATVAAVDVPQGTTAQQRAKQRKRAKRRALSIDISANAVVPHEQGPTAQAAAASFEPAAASEQKPSKALDDATPKDQGVDSKQVPAPASESDAASDSEALKPARRRLMRQPKKQQEKPASASSALAADETPTPVAAVTQSPPMSALKSERVKRARAAKESTAVSSSESAATARSAKPPTKRQRAEKLLMERRAVAQAAAAAANGERNINHHEGVDASANKLHSELENDEDEADTTLEQDTREGEDADEGEASDASTAGAVGTAGAQQIFSKLIDEAARQQWELLEVGRLVKLFAGQWGHKKKKTARFLRRFCPELVNVEFLEGLAMSLTPAQLVKIFERGSGTPAVLMNKLASAIENGNLTVRDAALAEVVATRAQHLPTNHDVLAFLLPLFESLSTVRDAGALLQHVCAHWHVERAATLVQQVLLTPVFHDLEGNQDEILRELPHLRGKLDFPSRLDEEDADEHGNLIGLIASEGSDLGEDSGTSDVDGDIAAAEDALSDVGSDDDDDEHSGSDDDDEADGDESYEGETDSEEERVVRRPKRRSRFVLDEADEGSESEDEEDEEAKGSDVDDDDADLVSEDSSGSESDSEDESWRSKPKRDVSAKPRGV